MLSFQTVLPDTLELLKGLMAFTPPFPTPQSRKYVSFVPRRN